MRKSVVLRNKENNMAVTVIGVNSPQAVRKYSALLATDVLRQSYFGTKFMATGADASAPIQVHTELEKDAGDKIQVDLSARLRQQPVEGDDTLEGNEENLIFFTDELQIDQMRCGVNGGGRMTRKRTLHDLRTVARARQSEWWSQAFDEQLFMALSGTRGENGDYLYPLSYSGFAGNAFIAPDASHQLYSGGAASAATITIADTFSLTDIDRAVTRARTLGNDGSGQSKLRPIKIDGGEHFVMILSPEQELSLRSNTNAGQWLDIQKAAAAAEGRNNPIFKGSLGMYNNVILHSHDAIIRYTGGVGANIPVARGLFLGAQACSLAWGTAGAGLRFDWNEVMRDNGNQLVISSSSIFGIKKTRFDGADYGVIAIDSAAPKV
jgi:N4-gp56 family major capsid protein